MCVNSHVLFIQIYIYIYSVEVVYDVIMCKLCI